MTDPLTDMFNRIKNAQAVLGQEVDMPYSNLKFGIAEILRNNGFIADCKRRGVKAKRMLKISLGYKDKIPAIAGFKRVSKPGKRIYYKAKEIKRVKNGYGIAIISTPHGLMTDREARKNRVGGEVMVEVW